MRSVKIPEATYKLVKLIAKQRGCFITKVLADAVSAYYPQIKEK